MNDAIEALATALLACAASVAVVQVFFRYALNNALAWPEELCNWMFVWAMFLGAGTAVARRGHIAIELLSPRLRGRARALQRAFVDASLAAAGAILLFEGSSFVAKTSYIGPGLGLSFKLLYAAVPACGALTLLFLLCERAERVPFSWRTWLPVLVGVLGYVVWLLAGPQVAEGGSVWVLMIVALGMIALEIPVAHSFVLGTFAAFAPQGDLLLVSIPQNMGSALNSFTLLAIPFFIVAAGLMNAAGITVRLVDFASALFGHLRGGLGHVNVATNTMMAGISGSSMADAAAIGKILIPEMTRRGYSPAFGCALTAAAGTLANLIPPSLGLIIYGALASASVGALFIGTIGPGLLTAAALALVVHILSGGRRNDLARATAAQRWTAFKRAIPALVLPVGIVGGVRFGLFTATESGAVAALYALFCGLFYYRSLNGKTVLAALKESMRDTVAVAVIIAAAAPFAWTLTIAQAPQQVARALGQIASNPIALLAVLNMFLLVVGLFMEMIASMVILVPILVPMIKAAGIDPVHFGIILVLNLVIGALTPPLGMLVFTTARVGHVPVAAVFRAVMPFLVALITVLLIVTYVPALTLSTIRYFGS